MVKLSSAVKRERAMKRRDGKSEVNRALAVAISRKLFSDGRKPEKGEVKSIMKNLTSVKERGDLGGSPKCASYAEAVGGMRRKEEPPSTDEGAKADGASAPAWCTNNYLTHKTIIDNCFMCKIIVCTPSNTNSKVDKESGRRMHKSRNGRAPCTSVEALLYKNAALTGAEIVFDVKPGVGPVPTQIYLPTPCQGVGR